MKKKSKSWLHHLRIHEWLCVGLLLISFLIRFYNFDYPIINGEVQRDYLVGRHIAYFGERVLTGPCCLWNGTFGNLRHSPVYYYFIAFLLRLFDNLMWVSFVNLALQVLSVWLLFKIGQLLFNSKTGLVAATFFALSSYGVEQSVYMWQPRLMSAFFLLTALLLTLTWKKHERRFLFVALPLFIFAGSIHSSLFALMPSLIVLIVYFFRKKILDRNLIFFLIIESLFGWLIAYGSVVVFLIQTKIVQGYLQKALVDLWVHSSQEFVNQIVTIIQQLFMSFFSSIHPLTLSTGLILTGIVFFRVKQKDSHNTSLVILLGIVLQFVVVVAFIKAPIWQFYLTPLFPLLFLIVAYGLTIVRQRNTQEKIVKAILYLFFIWMFSNSLSFLNPRLRTITQVDEGVESMVTEIKDIARQKGTQQLDFFQMFVVSKGVRSPPLADLVFWVPLEKKLQTQLFTLTDEAQSYALGPKSHEFVFLICQSDPGMVTEYECMSYFAKAYPFHKIKKQIYVKQSFHIYLTNKES